MKTITRRAIVMVLAAGLVAAGAVRLVGGAPAPTPPEVTAFIDDLVADSQRGQAASSDLSAASFATRLAKTKADLARVRKIDRKGLSLDDSLDLRFAETILVGRELSEERMQYWKKDPRIYMSFGQIDAIIGRPGDPASKRDALLKALAIIPRQLANGQKNLELYVSRFGELGVFMAKSGEDLFDKKVPAFSAELTSGREEVLAANTAARTALTAFQAFLQTDLPKRPHGDFAVGKSTYDAMLKGQYLLPYTADTLYKYAQDEFNRTVSELDRVAKTIDPNKNWQVLLAEERNDGPDPAKVLQEAQAAVNRARAHIVAKHLVPIPWKERCDVAPQPEYLRRNSIYGQFSGARSRPPEKDGTLVGHWQVNTFVPTWDDATKHDFKIEHDWGFYYVIAPHETYGGHHVQGLYQMHNPRKLRTALGTSLFSEGWGLYMEQLMQESGFFPNEKIHVRQLQSRLWRNARLVFVVGLHTGQMTYDQAMSFMIDKVGFTRYAAEAEVSRGISSPDQQMTYFMGLNEILKMREEYKRRMGKNFSLYDFHDRLLKIGSLLPALMRESLMAPQAGTN